MNEIGRSARSTSVTFVPRVAKKDAYSMPITPPPTTIIVRGISRSEEILSLVRTIGNSSFDWSGHPAGITGFVPHANRVNDVVICRSPSGLSIAIVFALMKEANPLKILILFLSRLERINCCSSWMTEETRSSSIGIVNWIGSAPAAERDR